MCRLLLCLLAEISKLYRQNEETHKTIAQLRDVLNDSRCREQAIESQLQAVVQHLRMPLAPGTVPPALPPLAAPPPQPPSTFRWDVLNRPSPPPDAPPQAQAPHPSLILPNPQLHGRPGLPQLSGNKL